MAAWKFVASFMLLVTLFVVVSWNSFRDTAMILLERRTGNCRCYTRGVGEEYIPTMSSTQTIFIEDWLQPDVDVWSPVRNCFQ